MAFIQFKLTKSINQSRDIFDKYLYSSDTDTISEVTAAGYFDESRFIKDDEWAGGIIECLCLDGYFIGEISVDGDSVSTLITSGGGVITSMNIIEVSTSYQALITDDIIVANGTLTVTLPLLASSTKQVSTKQIVGVLTVDGGASTIEGVATITLTSGQSTTIVPTSTGWVLI